MGRKWQVSSSARQERQLGPEARQSVRAWPRRAKAWPGNESCSGRGLQASGLAHPAFGSGLDGDTRAWRASSAAKRKQAGFVAPAKNENGGPAGGGAVVGSVLARLRDLEGLVDASRSGGDVGPAGDGASVVSVVECRGGPGPALARWLRAVSAGRASCWPHRCFSIPNMLTFASSGTGSRPRF